MNPRIRPGWPKAEGAVAAGRKAPPWISGQIGKHTLHKTDLVAISKTQFRGITSLYTPHCLALELSISPDKTPQTAPIEDLPCVRCCAGHFTLIGPGSLHQSFEGLAPHT